MDVYPVNPEFDADMARVRKLAELLDTRFEVAGIKFGWDSIIGLVPGAGDVATALIALYPLYVAQKHNLGRWTQLRMAGNVGLDALMGTIPLVGDLADVAFKANVKNLALLEKAANRRRRKSSRGRDMT